jgi:hypothetical protein
MLCAETGANASRSIKKTYEHLGLWHPCAQLALDNSKPDVLAELI